jgi:hypothetical protein
MIVRAAFSEDQVRNLNEFQLSGAMPRSLARTAATESTRPWMVCFWRGKTDSDGIASPRIHASIALQKKTTLFPGPPGRL